MSSCERVAGAFNLDCLKRSSLSIGKKFPVLVGAETQTLDAAGTQPAGVVPRRVIAGID